MAKIAPTSASGHVENVLLHVSAPVSEEERHVCWHPKHEATEVLHEICFEDVPSTRPCPPENDLQNEISTCFAILLRLAAVEAAKAALEETTNPKEWARACLRQGDDLGRCQYRHLVPVGL